MEQPLIITSKCEAQTVTFAQQCADKAQSGDIFTLEGPLGAGKSVFARAFIRHLMEDQNMDVPSPTFTLVQTYDSPRGLIWHFDLYRTENPDEIYEIGWEEAISNGIALVEWPQRLGTLLPAMRKEIIITPTGNESRKIELHTHQQDN